MRSLLSGRLTAAVLGIAAALPVPAQTVNPPVFEVGAPAYSEAELKSFAVAAVQVQRINLAYSPKLEAAASAEEQQELVQQAKEEVQQAVTGEGLSVARFQEILADARTHPEVAERVKQFLLETR